MTTGPGRQPYTGMFFDTPPATRASWAVLFETPARPLLAQALVEHGMLDSIAAGLGNARYRVELYIGEGNTIYLLAAAAVLVVLVLFRRRR